MRCAAGIWGHCLSRFPPPNRKQNTRSDQLCSLKELKSEHIHTCYSELRRHFKKMRIRCNQHPFVSKHCFSNKDIFRIVFLSFIERVEFLAHLVEDAVLPSPFGLPPCRLSPYHRLSRHLLWVNLIKNSQKLYSLCCIWRFFEFLTLNMSRNKTRAHWY